MQISASLFPLRSIHDRDLFASKSAPRYAIELHQFILISPLLFSSLLSSHPRRHIKYLKSRENSRIFILPRLLILFPSERLPLIFYELSNSETRNGHSDISWRHREANTRVNLNGRANLWANAMRLISQQRAGALGFPVESSQALRVSFNARLSFSMAPKRKFTGLEVCGGSKASY